MTWSTHSRRIVPISRSAKQFCHGEPSAMGLSRMPWLESAPDRGTVDRVAIADQVASGFQGNVSTICCAIHSAVGCAVALIQTSSRRANWTMTRTESRSKPIVGTTNGSIAAMCGAWLRKNVPACPDGSLFLTCTWRRSTGHRKAELEQLSHGCTAHPKANFQHSSAGSRVAERLKV